MKNHDSAFPIVSSPAHSIESQGMSLRDYFAAKAMQAYIQLGDPTKDGETIAADSYWMADQMMWERKQKK